MRKLLLFLVVVIATWGVYVRVGYEPCQPHPAITIDGRVFPAATCEGLSFDNVLVTAMTVVLLAALGGQIWKTTYYSTRGLGIFGILLLLLGLYGRAIVLDRLLGFPKITKAELALLRALLTWSVPLFAIGTARWYLGRIRNETIPAIGASMLEQEAPPD